MPNFSASKLEDFTRRVFFAVGATEEESQTVSGALVAANLAGHDSHGVIRIPEYVRWVEEGLVTLGAKLAVVLETEALAVVDGNWGWGQVMGREAMKLAIAKAKRSGAAVVAGRNCCHLGRIGDYAAMAAEEGMAAVLFVNTHGAGRLTAPFGGIERRLSANPIAAAAPRPSGGPIVVDISTCVIAEGKLRNMRNAGKPAPPGAIIDAEGKPSTRAADFYGPPQGALLPIAGHKGFALGLITDILAGALSGAGCSSPEATRVGNAFLAIVIDIERARGREGFARDIESLVDYVKSSKLAPGFEEILVPGEPESREQSRRQREGISLDETTWGQIAESAGKYRISMTA
ncbi:MAG: Ldh family oxidoreductase [Acidobacteria bacterium]|nr:Ldh family oxidoreductase [Acidobacteriota bacterium]